MTSRVSSSLSNARATVALALAALFVAPATSPAQTPTTTPPPAPTCPGPNFIPTLTTMLTAGSQVPTDTTATGARDCAFHEWSWEAFVWATALDSNGVPQFMSLKTPADLSFALPSGAGTGSGGSSSTKAGAKKPKLILGTRAVNAKSGTAAIEGAGAITEADGNMLVSKNGYPIYASVHMNDSYFQTAQNNLVVNGLYTANAGQGYDGFPVGALVFKAMWLRLDPTDTVPPGAFVTEAEVPVLSVMLTSDSSLYAAPSGATVTTKVALLGLHVVGRTQDHPEFVWGTFEHKLNSPRLPDGTYSANASSSTSYTLYTAGTLYGQSNQPSVTASVGFFSAAGTTITNTPTFTLNPTTQKFSPASNVVLANATGGESSPNGPANIAALNTAAQAFLTGLSTPTKPSKQSTFANYDLIGTVWMAPNSLTMASNQQNAVGSVNLANSTAETFVQNLSDSKTINAVGNCFSCHNPQTFTNVLPMPNLAPRFVALSHVTAAGSLYAVPNLIAVNAPPAPPTPAPIPPASTSGGSPSSTTPPTKGR